MNGVAFRQIDSAKDSTKVTGVYVLLVSFVVGGKFVRQRRFITRLSKRPVTLL